MNKKILLYLVPMLVVASSCGSKQKLAYFEDTKETVEGVIPVVKPTIRIEPDDELLINVTSEYPQATAIYNLPFNNAANVSEKTVAQVTPLQQTYIVNKQGDITFPVLGKLHVAGMTTQQLADELTRRIAEDVEAPTVRVQLVNFKVNVLGEVLQPGSYNFSTERVTVLDALASAGDMTIFGRRDNVTVYREEDGQVVYHKLNLNEKDIISSPFYYLKQNDVVYVEPGSSRSGQAEYNQNNSYKVSVITAITSACSVIATLVIALVINK